MSYEMAVWTDGHVHFVRLFGYTKREAIQLAKGHHEVTLYDLEGVPIFQKIDGEVMRLRRGVTYDRKRNDTA